MLYYASVNEPVPEFVKNCLDIISYIPITLSDLRFAGKKIFV